MLKLMREYFETLQNFGNANKCLIIICPLRVFHNIRVPVGSLGHLRQTSHTGTLKLYLVY